MLAAAAELPERRWEDGLPPPKTAREIADQKASAVNAPPSAHELPDYIPDMPERRFANHPDFYRSRAEP